MIRQIAAASVVATMLLPAAPALSQLSMPASPTVGAPVGQSRVPPPTSPNLSRVAPVSGAPLPQTVSLPEALEHALSRSPAVTAAEADVVAAEARARQAGYRENPELSFEIENFAGTGELRGLNSTEATLAVNQRLDLSGRRAARRAAARAELEIERLRLAVARANLAQSVRQEFARAVAARERLAQTDASVERARELARVTQILVDAGREPPLRSLRARSALAQALAEQETARTEDLAARTSLASLLGSERAVEAVTGGAVDLTPENVNIGRSLEIRLADAQRAAAEAALEVQLAERRLDPAVGVGIRHVRETGDFGLVAGFSMPLRIFDRNQGNVDAARAAIAAADARRAAALLDVSTRGRNAIAAVEAAERRVAALEQAAVREAAEALRLTELSYREGRSSLLELLDAQEAYTATQAALTGARLELALATADLGRIAAQ